MPHKILLTLFVFFLEQILWSWIVLGSKVRSEVESAERNTMLPTICSLQVTKGAKGATRLARSYQLSQPIARASARSHPRFEVEKSWDPIRHVGLQCI